jgi:predicted ribosomally synthesized peptide with nif11-like leader
MSIESAKAFMERLKTDEEFNNRVGAAKDQEARMALVKAEGFDFSAEDIKVLKDEMTDEELSNVNGGGGDKCGWDCQGDCPMGDNKCFLGTTI